MKTYWSLSRGTGANHVDLTIKRPRRDGEAPDVLGTLNLSPSEVAELSQTLIVTLFQMGYDLNAKRVR